MPTIKDYFQNIATAIKTKNSEIVTVTPTQMPQAILDIPSGGGGDISFEIPLYEDYTGGYVYDSDFFPASSGRAVNDIYEITPNHLYFLTLGQNRGNRFRAITTLNTTYEASSIITGTSIVNSNNPTNLDGVKFLVSNHHYLTISKSNDLSATGIKTYLIDCTDWS